MSIKFFGILTHQGAARLANAAALGTKLDLSIMAVGDGGGSLPFPEPTQTALKGERRRAALNHLSIDPLNGNQIIAEQVIPENEGGWWIREMGLFDKDGTLIAVANCPESYKPQMQEGSGRTQTIRMILIVNSTEELALKIGLRTAQVAGNNRKLARLREAGNVLFAAVGQGSDDDMLAVVAHKLGRHPFEFAAVKHIQKQGLQNIVAMVAERDARRTQFRGGAVKNAPAQT